MSVFSCYMTRRSITIRRTAGYTLIEIAIALVVVGLLLGSLLKAQELIRGAQLRRLISDHDAFRMAIIAFTDRFGYEPGDYNQASIHISCTPACLNGNGNRRVESNSIPVGGSEVHEELLVWSHLSRARFIPGNFAMSAGETQATLGNSPVNPSHRFWQFIFDAEFGAVSNGGERHNLKTGNLLPVEMMAQLDLRIDDGRPNTGRVQFSDFAVGGNPPTSGTTSPPACTSATTPAAIWNTINGSTNCGAASLF